MKIMPFCFLVNDFLNRTMKCSPELLTSPWGDGWAVVAKRLDFTCDCCASCEVLRPYRCKANTQR